MGAFQEKFGDLDDIFAYSTGKVVVLKDRFLGLLAIVLKLAILCYIIFTVVIDKGYYVIETPRGTTRMSLQIPPVPVDADLDYCTNLPDGGTNPVSQHRVLPCAYVDSDQLNVPTLGSQFFITTRLNRTLQNFNCPLTDYDCQVPPAYPATDIVFEGFIAGIENATLLLQHTVEGKGQVKLERSLNDMEGVVHDCSGNVVKRIPRSNGNIEDRLILVSELVQWAQPGIHGSCDTTLDLDDSTNGGSATLRYDGMILHVVIDYDNTEGSTDDVEYVVTVTALTQSDPKYTALSQVDDTHYANDNRHGLHIIVVQTGKLGQFSFAALVISMTAGLGLLAVANTITDLLAKHAMPLKEEYKKLIFEYSVDFSEFKKTQERKKDGMYDELRLSEHDFSKL